jgi:UDP-N-acetylglucosamine transferase subunit ALG13
VIFVTIGSMFPFDRLIRLVDELAPGWPQESFFAQVGESTIEPANMPFEKVLSARAFGEKVRSARLIVAHAGMGSVISAMEARKPIAVLPRLAVHGEVTTDHQLATARWLKGKPGVHVAMEEAELKGAIDAALAAPADQEGMSPSAPAPFLQKIRNFITEVR